MGEEAEADGTDAHAGVVDDVPQGAHGAVAGGGDAGAHQGDRGVLGDAEADAEDGDT
nr:hypothetical protein [Streptomyces lavendulae]